MLFKRQTSDTEKPQTSPHHKLKTTVVPKEITVTLGVSPDVSSHQVYCGSIKTGNDSWALNEKRNEYFANMERCGE